MALRTATMLCTPPSYYCHHQHQQHCAPHALRSAQCLAWNRQRGIRMRCLCLLRHCALCSARSRAPACAPSVHGAQMHACAKPHAPRSPAAPTRTRCAANREKFAAAAAAAPSVLLYARSTSHTRCPRCPHARALRSESREVRGRRRRRPLQLQRAAAGHVREGVALPAGAGACLYLQQRARTARTCLFCLCCTATRAHWCATPLM